MSIGPEFWIEALKSTQSADATSATGWRRLQAWSLVHPRASRVFGAAAFATVLSGFAVGAWMVGPEPPTGSPGVFLPLPANARAAVDPPTTPAATFVSSKSGIVQGPQHTLRVHTHLRLPLDKEVERVAVGSSEILDARLLNTRELLALGIKPGQTSILVWYVDGDIEQIDVVVTADLSLLERTLSSIHPSLKVEKAPDRDALVLTGRVPRAIYSRRAEDIANAWLDAAPSGGELLVGEAADSVADAQSASETDSKRRRNGGVINLIEVEGLPEYGAVMAAEDQLLAAIQSIGGEKVTVRRIQKGAVPDDEADILVLEGEVADQVALSRVLSLAYKLYVGNVKGPDVTLTDGVTGTTRVFEGDDLAIGDDIDVIADEAGALFSDDRTNIQQTQGLLAGFGQGIGTGGGGQTRLGQAGLDNQVDKNIARASALELANGRILSFIDVVDIPQVRVDIRLYEVNRTKLLSYQSDVGVIVGDFTQGGLNPAGSATTLQGFEAARVGATGEDIQNAFSFLEGSLTNQLQFSGSNWAVDSLFSFLETEDIAKSLANPSLSVLSGELALFQVGGRVPIEQAFGTQVGIQGVFNSVAFIEFGVNLAVRPLVGEDDFITIDFAPEIITPDALLTQAISEATGANPATFAFESRLLRSSSRLMDGQTLLVGGLQQTQRSDTDEGAPWLKDIPMLGLLFQGFDYSDDDLEVVVMIRPTIVRDPLPDAAMWVFPDCAEMLQAALPPRPEPEPEEGAEAPEASDDGDADATATPAAGEQP